MNERRLSHPGINAWVFLLAVLAFTALACRAQERMGANPAPTATLPAQSAPTPFRPSGPDPQGKPTLPVHGPEVTQPSPDGQGAVCQYSPVVEEILSQTSAGQWLDWIEKLSGAEPVVVGGNETTIKTRFTPAMFDGQSNAQAFDYLLETVQGWYPPGQIDVMEYQYENEYDDWQMETGKNLSVRIQGSAHPEELVLLTAHLDSITEDNPYRSAPGAEDNASGAAALLEAARILRDYRFERTLQIVWFTGEELGLFGSEAFAAQIDDPSLVVGVVNLDMFGYDSDGDRCFEIHAGEMTASQMVGQCFIDGIQAYGLDLPRYDFLVKYATDASDHSSFWREGIGAIEILEDMGDQQIRGGCPSSDPNPNYHTPHDTVDLINPDSGIQIVRAAIAAAASLAGAEE